MMLCTIQSEIDLPVFWPCDVAASTTAKRVEATRTVKLLVKRIVQYSLGDVDL